MLDDVGRTDLGFGRIEPDGPACLALVEQVIALVELNLDLFEALDVGLAEAAAVACPGEEEFLFCGKLVDVQEEAGVFHCFTVALARIGAREVTAMLNERVTILFVAGSLRRKS